MIISFIGFGNMAKAIAHGLLHDSNLTLRAASPSLTAEINQHGIMTHHDNKAIVTDAHVIILGVKPIQMATVMADIASHIPPKALVISIASGITLSWFIPYLPKTAIVRAMPNIAASIGESATPLIANQLVTSEQKQWALHIFNRIGISTWAEKEVVMDAFTALSGSGPAYVFLFMEAMIKAGVQLGIPMETAKTFTLQTVEGAINLAWNSQSSLETLRKSVTSKAGTTEAAIDVLNKHGFNEIIATAMENACNRAKELGRL